MKTKAQQYFEISPNVLSLRQLCDNKCEAEFTHTGHYRVWIFDDDSIIRVDDNQNITVDGVMK